MRDQMFDQEQIRKVVKQAGFQEVVYITPNHYDGGYEVRVGTQDVFVEYATLDAGETHWLDGLRS